MLLTIWNCVLSYQQNNKFSENWHVLPRNYVGVAMVLGQLPVLWCPTIWMTVGQGPIALAEGASGGWLDIFTLLYPFSPLSPSL